ncbi:MAG: cyclase [Parvicella sp.]
MGVCRVYNEEKKRMKAKRIIARLDIKGPNVVKGIHLEGLRVLGDPSEMAQFYYEQGADELFYQDVVASLYERNSLRDFISETAKKSFIPLTVGGGIRTLDDIKRVLRAGADKVSINTAGVRDPDFIKQAVNKFGSSTIVCTIEAIKQPGGDYLAFVDNGREHTGLEVLHWAERVQDLGVGELVITSVDREGTGKGFDLQLIKEVRNRLEIPIIAHGGAGKAQDVYDVFDEGKVNAVALSSIIHYEYLKNSKNEILSKSEGNTNFLKSGRSFTKIEEPISIMKLKQYLIGKGFLCRI